MSKRLYSDVVSGSSSDEENGVHSHWLSEYQTESEDVAVEKTLEASKVMQNEINMI